MYSANYCIKKDAVNVLTTHLMVISFIANSAYVGVLQVIPIKDPVVLSKIHQTYRIGYLKVSLFNFYCKSSFGFTCMSC